MYYNSYAILLNTYTISAIDDMLTGNIPYIL